MSSVDRRAVAWARFSCRVLPAVLLAGVACSGTDEAGKGTGSLDTGDSPAAVTPARGWPGMAVGFDHWCVLDDAGSLSCSGNGFLGQTDPPAGAFVSADSGLQHGCGLRADGTAACWGFDAFGAAEVPDAAFLEVDAGGYHSCGIRLDGMLSCWGGIRDGEADAPSGTFSQVSGGEGHTCALRTDGEPVCWGLDDSGQASPPDVPMAIIRSGWTHSCGLEPDGAPRCWGEDTNGEASPPDLRFVDIGAGRHVSCGIDGDGGLHCWGHGAEGLDDPPEGRFDALSMGSSSACARTVDGQIECWGALADDVPRQDRTDAGFHLTGIAWDMALRDWSTPGLCLSAMDPFSFWRNADIERTSTTRIQGAGAFELPDVVPVTDFGVMYLVEDCEGVHDVVPTASGVMASLYADRVPGDTIGGAFAISFDRAMLDAWTEDLYTVGYRGGDIVSRGGNFIVVVDEEGRFVSDATVTCDDGACPDTYYLDPDASDGRFGAGTTPNTATSGAPDMGVLVLGSNMRSFGVEHPTLEFDAFEMASRPGTMTVFMFVAR